MPEPDVLFDDEMLNRILDKAHSAIDNPEPLLHKIGSEVVVPGFRMQFRTKGTHWGELWQERGKQMKHVRREQGRDPSTTLMFSTTLMNSFVPMVKNKELIVGTTQSYAKKLQEGTTEPQTFQVDIKGKLYTITVMGIPPRMIQPLNGLTTDEKRSIARLVKDHIEDELSTL